MLERMHAAKNKKMAFEQLKADAQAEAKERAAKAKARRLEISMVQVNENQTEDYTAPLLVPLGIVSPQVTCMAILDSGADVNVISKQLYQGLQTNKLLPTTAVFQGFSNQQTQCIGILTMNIFIQEQEEPCTFYVTDTNDYAHEVILGRNWMAKHQCSIDWDSNIISLRMCNKRLVIKPRNLTTTKERRGPTIAVKQEVAHIPRNTSYINPTLSRRQTKCKQRWVPVQLLKVQGYYKGTHQIWIPKLPVIGPPRQIQPTLYPIVQAKPHEVKTQIDKDALQSQVKQMVPTPLHINKASNLHIASKHAKGKEKIKEFSIPYTILPTSIPTILPPKLNVPFTAATVAVPLSPFRKQQKHQTDVTLRSWETLSFQIQSAKLPWVVSAGIKV